MLCSIQVYFLFIKRFNVGVDAAESLRGGWSIAKATVKARPMWNAKKNIRTYFLWIFFSNGAMLTASLVMVALYLYLFVAH